MKKRYKMNKSKSRKSFKKGASKTHKFNNQEPGNMRGGIRM